MSGTPTEAEIQAMVTNAVDILEKHRVYADAVAFAGGELDVLEQSLEGEYAPGLANVAADFRSGLSDLASAGVSRAFLDPLILEYGKYISDNPASGTGSGSGSTDAAGLMRALYEHMVNNSLTVESRAITYDTTATATNGFTGAALGTGAIDRLTVDAKAHDLEACAIEKKVFRCRQDQNTGTNEEEEIFEVMGEAQPLGNLGKNAADVAGQLGTGLLGSITALSAGTNTSLFRNGSFSTYNATATPKFTGWDLSAGTAADVTQDTTNTYRSHPGESVSGSLKIAASVSDTKTLRQTLTNLRVSSIDPDAPYFCRIMVNKTIGSASGGSVVLRCGTVNETITIAGLGADWQEIRIGTTTPSDSWAKNFIEDGFAIEIEWTQSTSSGFLLVDDAIFAPWTEIDGTFWALRQVHATAPIPWAVDDTLELTDTGGAPATAEIQYWLYRSGLGYLPHTTGAPTWAEPV